MAVYVVTGKLGGGKSLICVGKIRDKLLAGRPVVTNLDLKLHKLLPASDRSARVIRLPDQPSADDLHAIGYGNRGYDESRNGLLVLDECGTWFNARSWNDKSRKGVNDWFLHARKLGWDVMLIVQDIEILDSQARRAIAEHTVFCKRLDRIHLPGIGALYKLLVGEPLRLPRVHVGKVIYGTSESTDPLSDRWVYRGTDLFSAYDTKQIFLDEYPHAIHSVLPGWHTNGRYQRPRDWKTIMRLTKIYWKRFKSPFALAAGIAIGATAASYAVAAVTKQQQPVQVETVMSTEPVPIFESMDEGSQLADRLRELRIVGFIRMGSKSHYHFTSVNSESGERGYPIAATSAELIQMGVGVRTINECHVVLTHGSESLPIYCR